MTLAQRDQWRALSLGLKVRSVVYLASEIFTVHSDNALIALTNLWRKGID